LVRFRVRRYWRLLLYWLPVVLWMSLIFTASSDQGSFQRSSRLIAPIVRWLYPSIDEHTLFQIVFVIRKCAHVTEYGILALMVWRARVKPLPATPLTWEWRIGGEALWVAVFYATTDEFHQTFVSSREGCLRDVAVDSSGAVGGLLLLFFVGKLFGKWRK
jgi:VanZ family protein